MLLELSLGDPVETTVNEKHLSVGYDKEGTKIKYGDSTLTLGNVSIIEGLAIAVEWALGLYGVQGEKKDFERLKSAPRKIEGWYELGDGVTKEINGKTLCVQFIEKKSEDRMSCGYTEVKYGDEKLILTKETTFEGIVKAIKWVDDLYKK